MAISAINAANSQETLLASGTRTVTGTGTVASSFGGVKDLIVQLAVTAASGTLPTLDVIIQHSVDDGTNWHDVAGLTFTQATAATAELKVASSKVAGTVRVKYTIAGTTPSFTFSVKAFARG